MIKKQFYILSFMVLGALLGLLAIALVQLFQARRDAIVSISYSLQTIIILFGALLGYIEGRHWWQAIYVEKAYLNWKKASFRHKNRWHGFSMMFIIFIILTFTVAFLWN